MVFACVLFPCAGMQWPSSDTTNKLQLTPSLFAYWKMAFSDEQETSALTEFLSICIHLEQVARLTRALQNAGIRTRTISSSCHGNRSGRQQSSREVQWRPCNRFRINCKQNLQDTCQLRTRRACQHTSSSSIYKYITFICVCLTLVLCVHYVCERHTSSYINHELGTFCHKTCNVCLFV
jgi:hypothetical protein